MIKNGRIGIFNNKMGKLKDLAASCPPVEMDADVRLEAVREALAELILVPYKQSPK